MSRFIESICILKGMPQNLHLHLKRIHKTQLFFYKKITILNLDILFRVPLNFLTEDKVKCKIIYDQNIIAINYMQYECPIIKRLELVHTKMLLYDFKYKNRLVLDTLFECKKNADDIIIINNKNISDSYYANLVFEDESGNLITPKHALLKGIKREIYLQKKIIIEKQLQEKDIKNFIKIHLINAMLDLGDVIVNL